MPHDHFPGRLVLSILLMATAQLSGCGSTVPEDRPETFPVGGKVTYEDGAPVADVLVVFHPVNPPSDGSAATAMATTDAQGEFKLKMVLRDGMKVDGARPGPHHVSISRPLDPDQNAQPVALPEPYTVKSGGQENYFTLRIRKSALKPLP
jgi:hypothetical protein